MAASSYRTIFINSDINYVAGVLRNLHFQNFTGFSFKSELPSYNNGVAFRFTNSVSFTSWGEEIIITITPDASGALRVDISSECSMPTQLIDWGKNKENLNKVVGYMQNYCQQQSYATNGYAQGYPQQSYPQQGYYQQGYPQQSYPQNAAYSQGYQQQNANYYGQYQQPYAAQQQDYSVQQQAYATEPVQEPIQEAQQNNSETKTCPHCGTELSSFAVFCYSCGERCE